MSDKQWTPTEREYPKSGTRVDWISRGGEQVDGGTYDNGLWILPGGDMYVYFPPVFWRPAADAAGGK